MSLIRIVLLLTVLSSLSGCNFIREHFGDGGTKKSKVRNGLVKTYRADKTLLTEINYVNDTIRGVHRTFYKNGKLKKEMTVIDSKRNGSYKLFYDNGKLRSEVPYVQGIKNGIFKSHYKDGKLYTTVNYIDGLKQGLETKYHENGSLMSKLNYKDGYPGMGLQEFNKQGKLLTNYPTIQVNVIDNLKKNGRYRVEIMFSKKHKKSKFYIGELADGKYIYDLMSEVRDNNGQGFIDGKLPPGQFLMEKLNIVGCYITRYGNTYITTKRYNLALDNNL